MNRVTLNKDEARWFSRNVIKTHVILLANAKKDPKVLERATFKTIDALLEQAGEISKVLEQLAGEPFEIDIYVTKRQRLVLNQMIGDTNKVLVEHVLPKYQSRGFDTYIADTKVKIDLLTKMQRKF